jgi:septal ring factor EnvC (AmiA/AmiB activator)
MLFLSKTVFKNIILAISIIILGFAETSLAKKLDFGYGVIIAPMKYMAAPDEDAEVLSVIPEGMIVRVLDVSGGWLKIYFDSKSGYVLELPDSIEIIKTTKQGLKENDSKKLTDQAVKQHIKDREIQIRSIRQEEDAYIEELHETERLLNGVRLKIIKLEKDLTALDETIHKTQDGVVELKEKQNELEAAAMKRLVSAYKLKKLGLMVIYASSNSLTDMLKRKYILRRIIGEDEKAFETLIAHQESLKRLLETLITKKAEKRGMEQALSENLQVLSEKQKRRQQLLKEIRSEKALAVAALNSLKRAEASLNDTFAALQQVEPEPEMKQNLLSGFPRSKGLLIMPVRGKIIKVFGHYKDPTLKTESLSKGIDIQADYGEPIRAVATGNVLYSEWLKGYGNLMILEHGDHYHTVYAHAQELFKGKGDSVQAGEVIATVGDSGSWNGPMLHFEIRHHGQPINPLEWFGKEKGNKYAHQ